MTASRRSLATVLPVITLILVFGWVTSSACLAQDAGASPDAVSGAGADVTGGATSSQDAMTSPNAIGGTNPYESLPNIDAAGAPTGGQGGDANAGASQSSDSAQYSAPAGGAQPEGASDQPDRDLQNAGSAVAPLPPLPDRLSQFKLNQIGGAAPYQALRPGSKLTDSPLRKALNDLKAGNYTDSLDKLDKYLEKYPKQTQAHYLKAVVFVLTRHFKDAETEYRTVIEQEPDTEIARLAQRGLTKLAQ